MNKLEKETKIFFLVVLKGCLDIWSRIYFLPNLIKWEKYFFKIITYILSPSISL